MGMRSATIRAGARGLAGARRSGAHSPVGFPPILTKSVVEFADYSDSSD